MVGTWVVRGDVCLFGAIVCKQMGRRALRIVLNDELAGN